MVASIEGGPSRESMESGGQETQEQGGVVQRDLAQMSKQAIEASLIEGDSRRGLGAVETALAVAVDTDYDNIEHLAGRGKEYVGMYAPGDQITQADIDTAAKAALEVYRQTLKDEGEGRAMAAANRAADKATEVILKRRAELKSGGSS